MRYHRLRLALCLGVFLGLNALASDFFFRDGDRVVFLGDSITEQRLYTTYIEGYVLARFPEWNVSFRNVGWGGDTSWLRQRSHPDEAKLFAAEPDAQQRMVEDAVRRGLERDVLPLKPTAVTIKFGMNDHSYQPFREDIFNAYIRSQKQLAEVLSGKGARVAFLTPQPIEDRRPDPDKDPRNQSLRRFSDGLEQLAGKLNCEFADQFAPYMQMLLRERQDNPQRTIGGGDAVHPGPIGHTVMAWAVLKELGAPSLVSRAEIDARTGKVKSAEGCSVTNIKMPAGGLSFERTDEALPMPIDARAESALGLAPILNDLSRYELKVTGLSPGTYEVKVDGEPCGSVSAEQLAAGWNLTTNAAPIVKQTRDLLAAVFKKNDIFFTRWRNVQLYQFPKWADTAENNKLRQAEIDKLDAQVTELESEINSLRKPVVHRFELTKH